MMKRTLQRIDINAMKRLMSTLYENGYEKRTNLARNANMNYDTCVHYLIYLEFIDFAKKIIESKYEKYGLTVNGISFCQNKLSVKSELNDEILV